MCSPVVLIAMAAANLMLARSEKKSTIAFAEMAATEQREQLKDERLQTAIETAEKLNVRKEEMSTRLATNRALLSPAGITADSWSFRALLASNKSKGYKDLRNIGLSDVQKRRDHSYTASDIERNLLATKISAKNKFTGQAIKSIKNAYSAYAGMKQQDTGQAVGSDSPNYKYYSSSDKSFIKDRERQ